MSYAINECELEKIESMLDKNIISSKNINEYWELIKLYRNMGYDVKKARNIFKILDGFDVNTIDQKGFQFLLNLLDINNRPRNDPEICLYKYCLLPLIKKLRVHHHQSYWFALFNILSLRSEKELHEEFRFVFNILRNNEVNKKFSPFFLRFISNPGGDLIDIPITQMPESIIHASAFYSYIKNRDKSKFLNWVFNSMLSCENEHQWSIYFVIIILGRVGFQGCANDFNRSLIYEHLIIPILKRAMCCKKFNTGLEVNSIIYEKFLLTNDTEDRFNKIMRDISPIWIDSLCTINHIDISNQKNSLMTKLENDHTFKVAFHLESHGKLAHTEVLISAIKAYKSQQYQPFVPLVVVGSFRPEWSAELEAIGVSVLSLNEMYPDIDLFSKYLALRDYLNECEVYVFVQMCYPLTLPFLFSMPMGCVKVWWSVKYFNFFANYIDGYLTCASIYEQKIYYDMQWNSQNVYYENLYDSKLSSDANEIRSKFTEDTILLASLAREEKINDIIFLKCVVDILKANSNCVYLWTGREKNDEINRFFEQSEVIEQTVFVGWVDTRIYAQVIDIFLDTRINPCGLTIYQAMAAKKAVLLWDTPHNRIHGILGYIKEGLDEAINITEDILQIKSIFIKDTRVLKFAAQTPEEFINFANHLICEPEERMNNSIAFYEFSQYFLANAKRSGRSLARSILSIVKSCL